MPLALLLNGKKLRKRTIRVKRYEGNSNNNSNNNSSSSKPGSSGSSGDGEERVPDGALRRLKAKRRLQEQQQSSVSRQGPKGPGTHKGWGEGRERQGQREERERERPTHTHTDTDTHTNELLLWLWLLLLQAPRSPRWWCWTTAARSRGTSRAPGRRACQSSAASLPPRRLCRAQHPAAAAAAAGGAEVVLLGRQSQSRPRRRGQRRRLHGAWQRRKSGARSCARAKAPPHRADGVPAPIACHPSLSLLSLSPVAVKGSVTGKRVYAHARVRVVIAFGPCVANKRP